MKRIKEGILLIYAIMIIFCFTLVYKNNHEFYNNVKVIDDREEIEEKTDTSIPVKIQISNEKLGDYDIDYEISMKDILDSIKEITSYRSWDKNAQYGGNEVAVTGDIYYLNGNKRKFILKNSLEIDNTIYDGNSSAINTLRNSLISYLYTSNNLATMIKNSSDIEAFNSNKKLILNNEQKAKLIDEVLRSNNVVDNNKLIGLKSEEKPLYHINMYFDKKTDGKVNSFDMAIIDVFNGYYVFQYLGDENGRQIYFTGSLNKIAFLEE